MICLFVLQPLNSGLTAKKAFWKDENNFNKASIRGFQRALNFFKIYFVLIYKNAWGSDSIFVKQ